MAGATGHAHTKPLKKEKAIEVGAEILGEAFIYTVAASVILLEYWRTSRKESMLEAEQDKDIDILMDKVKRVEDLLENVEHRVQLLEKPSNTKDKKA